MLICAGSEAAKWSAIQEAANFRKVLGKKTEISAEQGSQVASLLKQRGKKNQIDCLCHLSLIVLSRKRPFIQRNVFHERNQEPTEAASEWVTRLHLLIQDSYFTGKGDITMIKITRG